MPPFSIRRFLGGRRSAKRTNVMRSQVYSAYRAMRRPFRRLFGWKTGVSFNPRTFRKPQPSAKPFRNCHRVANMQHPETISQRRNHKLLKMQWKGAFDAA
jgi:hypothetical protein